MDKVFKVEITNGEPDGYLYATQLDLPASEDEYAQAKHQAKVTNFVRMEAEVLQVYQGPVTAEMVDGTPFSELNTLAAVLSQLDNTQAFALEGMLKIRQKATGVQEIPVSDILHMADNTDRCMVATHIWDHLATWRTTPTGAWWPPTFGTTWPWDIFSMKRSSCPRAPPGCWM